MPKKKTVLELLSEAKNPELYTAVAEVCVPNTVLGTLSFGVDENIKTGSLVWVSLKNRKKPLLALVFEVHKNHSNFKLKPAIAHKSNYAFSKRYIETISWCANYYMCSLGEALTACWPADLERYLDEVNA